MGWRDVVLQDFIPGLTPVTLVADPDGLLLEERVSQAVRERGFELLTFQDPVEFRYVYESRYRSRWDQGGSTEIVVRWGGPDLSSLPYDLLHVARRLSLSLGTLFPNLSYPVVATLDRADLDDLYAAQEQQRPPRLGENETRAFALRHVFGIMPELTLQPSDLLRLLLRWHYNRLRVPPTLNEHVVSVLRASHRFGDWPLEKIVSDREAFLDFLQERWPVFLDQLMAAASRTLGEHHPPYAFRSVGAPDLPFDHEDVRVYIDNLFVEGLLQPVDHPGATTLKGHWAAVGLATAALEEPARRLARLLDAVEKSLPPVDARHRDWLAFAYRWGEATALRHSAEVSVSADPGLQNRYAALQAEVDAAFVGWVDQRYAGLHSQPPYPPVMLHHVPRALAQELQGQGDRKVALVVLDGLAVDQWIVLRDALATRRPDLQFREEAVFAWAPTTTPVSRQALFAGRPPIFFPESIDRTDRDASRWTQFWAEQGLASAEVAYASALRARPDLARVNDLLSHPKTRVVGLVVDQVDRIMHGVQLGTAGMHGQVRQWAGEGFLAELLDTLLVSSYGVWLTSDHGNVEATGCGSPAEGVVADVRGERVRVYSDATLRAQVAARFPGAIAWPAIGLPADFLPLIAPDRSAFVKAGERVVSHGGTLLEELVVPFIQVVRRA